MLDQLIAMSQEFDQHKTDYGPHPVGRYMFAEENILAPTDLFNGAKTPLWINDWSWQQICQRLGVAAFPNRNRSLPADYLDACPTDIRTLQLNHWNNILHRTGRQWFVRAYDSMCRAVLTERYAPIGVTDTLQWVKDALDSKGGGEPVALHKPFVSPDVLHLRVLFRDVDTPGGPYGIGGYFTTGETGNRRLGAYPLIQRHACTNSIAVDNSFRFEHLHIGNRLVLKRTFLTAVYSILDGAVEALDKLLAADEQELPNFADFVDGLVARKGWSVKAKDRILIGSEGRETLWGVVMGVSAAAKAVEDPTEAADMELVAGSYLS